MCTHAIIATSVEMTVAAVGIIDNEHVAVGQIVRPHTP